MQSKSISNTVLMVRPAHFGFNVETAANNAFQTEDKLRSETQIAEQARLEFDNMVTQLRQADVEVIVIEDTDSPVKPDSIFPNNWFSTHVDTIVTYPMYAKSRRVERREDIIALLTKKYQYANAYKFENHENVTGQMLEGTGSMILDRDNKIAYACISQRTHEELFFEWCRVMNYAPMSFTSIDRDRQLIYHTNVMMALGVDFVVICMASIPSPTDREKLLDSFAMTGKEVVDISLAQMEKFAGNMLQVKNTDGQGILVMSSQAHNALTAAQLTTLQSKTKILVPNIQTIENIGGGSVRCMMAEIF